MRRLTAIVVLLLLFGGGAALTKEFFLSRGSQGTGPGTVLFTSITPSNLNFTTGANVLVGTAISAVNSGTNTSAWSAQTSGFDSNGVACNNNSASLSVSDAQSTAPSGPTLINTDGTWTWGAAVSGRPGEYNFLLNGTSTGIGLFAEIFNGQIYINTATGGWFVYNAGFIGASTPPNPGFTGVITAKASAPVQSYPGTCLRVTQSGVDNSPYSQAFTFVGTAAGASFTSITLPTTTFTAGTAGTVGTASSAVNSGVNSPTWSIKTSGTDSATGATCNNYPYFSIATTGVPTGITFSPTNPSLPDNSAVGTLWTTATVAMNSGPFTGSLTSSNTDLFAISGLNINTARTMGPADDGSITTSITATQNNQTGILTVNANALAQSYPGTCLQVTQTGVANSPYSQAFTLTNTGGATTSDLSVATNGHYLNKGSAPFFFLGDTEWILNLRSDADVSAILSDRATKGFTVVQVMATRSWNVNGSGDVSHDANGNLPFIGNDPTQLNSSYWTRWVSIADQAKSQGLYFLLVYGEPGNGTAPWNCTTGATCYEYGRRVGATFAGKTNVIFADGQDSKASSNTVLYRAMAEGVADGVNGVNNFDGSANYNTTMMTYHGPNDQVSTLHQDTFLDFYGVEVYGNIAGLYNEVISDYNLTSPTKPIMILEGDYETFTYPDGLSTPYRVRLQAWNVAFAGGAYSYGHNSDYLPSQAPSTYLNSVGAQGMAVFSTFMRARPWQNLVPHQAAILSATGSGETQKSAVQSTNGNECLVYYPAVEAVTISMGCITSSNTVNASWFDPRNGNTQTIGSFATSTSQTLTPPGGLEDAVLVLDAGTATPQAIASITPSACSFAAGTQNGAVCTLSVTMNSISPASTASLALTGTNSGAFHLTGIGCSNISTGTCTIQQSSSVGGTPAGNYTDVNVVATQSGATNSPFTQALNLTGSNATCSGGSGAPSICVNKTAVNVGDTLTITYDPGPYPSTGSDTLGWMYNGGARWLNWANFSIGSAANGPGTYNWTVLGEPSEYPIPIVIEYTMAANIPGSLSCANGTCLAAISVPVTIAPTVTLPPLTATPPADVLANPPGWPASPAAVITVCPSGCGFTTPSAGVAAAGSTDFTQVRITAGTYDDCLNPPGSAISFPPHLWVKGVGGGFAHLRATIACNSDAAIQANIAQLTIDNLELSDFNSGNFAGLRTFCGNNVILRNVYWHDGGMGILTGVGNCQSDFTILNSHFARAGGSVGPSHLAYFNDTTGSGNVELIPNDHLTVKRSVFEMALYGHLLKTHENVNTIDCNVLLESYAAISNGSLALDFDGGGGQSTVTNNLIGQGPYFNGTNNNEGIVNYGRDLSGWNGDQPTQFLVFTGNTVINDLVGALDTISNGKEGYFIALGRPMTPSGALPYTWSNNTFIGPRGAADPSLFYVADAGNATNVNLDSSNHFYPTRAAAGLPSITPGAYYNWPYDSSKFPMPSACSGQPIGNVAIP